jgi:hypothetical protein
MIGTEIMAHCASDVGNKGCKAVPASTHERTNMDNETFKCKMSRYSMAFRGEISAAKNTRTKKYSI